MLANAQLTPTALHGLLDEASRALATLDAERLEELAASCLALSRDLPEVYKSIRFMRVDELQAARSKLSGFARVLDGTRGNLEVIHQVSALEASMLEYTYPARNWGEEPRSDGND